MAHNARPMVLDGPSVRNEALSKESGTSTGSSLAHTALFLP